MGGVAGQVLPVRFSVGLIHIPQNIHSLSIESHVIQYEVPSSESDTLNSSTNIILMITEEVEVGEARQTTPIEDEKCI
jgi:hypothetical protein